MKFVIAAAVVLMLIYLVPSLVWPVAKESMSQVPLPGDLVIIGILGLGAVIMVAGLVGILGRRN